MVFSDRLTPQRLGTTLMRLTQAALSCQNLMIYDGNFEPMVKILPVQIKDQNLS